MELIIKEFDGCIKPRLCLNMIVKNESHIIENTLDKLLKKIPFDYWVISDTGSTDNTKEIISKFFTARNIPGELFDDKWEDFGHNRTIALEHAYGKSDYILVFDADDEICGNFILPELIKDAYALQFGDANGTSYTRPQIVNNHKKWKYIGVLHEIIECCEHTDGTVVIRGDYYTISGRTSDRNRDENKYLKDALILEKAYNKSFAEKDAIYNRYGFYCANSYYDAGKYEQAIKWFKITLDNNNWTQEKYVSCLRIYNCYSALKQNESGLFYLVKAFSYDKERVECLYELVSYYCGQGMNDVAHGYYTINKAFYSEKYLTQGLQDKLFLDVNKAEFFLPYYMIIVCDRTQDLDTAIQMYKIVFTKKYKETNHFFIGNLLYNLQFFIEKAKDDTVFIHLFKEYVKFLISIDYPIYKHEFMANFEKYGITVKPTVITPKFTQEECLKSNNILIYTGYCDIKWNHSYSLNNALGGSETAVISLANNFPTNYQIYIAGNVAEETVDNIQYVHIDKLGKLIENAAFHTIIVSRYVNFYENFNNFSAHQTFIWGHDVVLFPYNTNLSVENILSKWSSKINGCICQTDWHRDQFLSLYPQLNDKIIVINNGINTNLFNFKSKKVANRFIYTSCSERGLNRLLELWPTIIENLPDAELCIASYNPFPSNEAETKMKTIIDNYSNIKHFGKLKKNELYELMAASEYWLYPTNFNETSCITSMEMLMSEVICIYYPVAGLVNTLGDYGIPIEKGREIETIANLTNKRKFEIRKCGKEYAASCSWENRANCWRSLMNTQDEIKITSNTSNIMIKYGTKNKNIDVTKYVFDNLVKNNTIYIEKDDNVRASMFTDPDCGIKKHIYICNSSGKILKEFNCNEDVLYSLKQNANMACIKVINLKKREDRKNEMIKQLQNEGIVDYEIIEAIDGLDLNETPELGLLFEKNNFKNKKGVIGCALSHIKTWQQLIDDELNDYYVILEDDITLYDNFKYKLEKHCELFQEYGAEHLSLGVSDCNDSDQQKIYSQDISIFEKDVYKFWNITFAYIINKQGAVKILDFIKKCSIKSAIDNPQAYGCVLTHYHTTHCIAKQRDPSVFGTDIQNNHNNFNFVTKDNTNSQLKISFCDWWQVEYCGGYFDFNNNFIVDILKKGGINDCVVVEPNQDPDILFYSIFGDEHKNYKNVRRVFFSGEPFGPRDDADYNITFDKTQHNNHRFPLWLGYLNSFLLEECTRRRNGIIHIPKREKFCSFISNGEVKTTHRKNIVEKLSRYKKVHCGGKFLNNIGYTVPRGENCSGKIEHNNSYKFAIAFENEDYPGYVTEKICDIYKSNCIPIYWGTKEVVKDFNPNTFINANDFANFDELVEYIIKVDNDPKLYASFFQEPTFSNKWIDVLNDPHKTFYKNMSDCIIGKHTNLYKNYLDTQTKLNDNVKIFNIWHNKLFDNCYKELDEYSLGKITMYDVNDKYKKIYNHEKNYNILKEYELKHFNRLYQDTNYCQTSCLYHIYKNNLYDKTDYVGFIQYDMELAHDFIYDMEQKINNSVNDIYFYSLAVSNKIDVKYICEPYSNSILEKYNQYFNTNHTYETIRTHKKSGAFICLHTFVIPTKSFVKMMTWYCTITDWLHTNYINGIYDESMSEVTEEIFGLYLLLRMIEDDSIQLEELKLNHEWPKLHNETEFFDYKVRMPISSQQMEMSLEQIVDNLRTDKNTTHSYLPLYQNLLASKKETAKNVLEIGIGDFNQGITNGGSIKLWHDYFKNATVHALDICPLEQIWDGIKNNDRISIYSSIDAYNNDFFISNFLNKNIKCDFMLDDGPHSLESMTQFIKLYSQIMTDDGILIVEDVQSWDWVDILKNEVPEHLKQFIKIYDLRSNKNRYDDIVFTIDKSKQTVCFDIGANIGNWSLKNINKYDKILAIEAAKDTFTKLTQNVSNTKTIVPLNYAVCDSTEENIAFYNCESDVLSTLNNKWLTGGISRFNVNYTESIVKTISIDKLIEKYGVPDLIKIDVETAEYQCLRSMTQKCKTICFEWASEFLDIVFNCLNYLYQMGYREFYIQMNNDDYAFVPHEYYNIEKAKTLLNKTTPKNEWGMIWGK